MNRMLTRANRFFLLALPALAVFVAAAMPVWSQAPALSEDKSVAVSKIERKNRAPVSGEILRVTLPKPFETKLENGLGVLILEDHRFPLVYAQLSLNGAGGLYEPRNLPGLASITASMLREGTTSRNSRQISEEVDRLGASLGAFTGQDSTDASVSASGLSDNFDQWFGLAVDVLLNPAFPADELNKLKQRMKVGLKQQRSQPSFLAEERFRSVLFGDHPAAVISPTEQSIDAITPEMLAKWHRERYVPQTGLLAIVGDVKARDVIARLNKWLAGWKPNDFAETLPAHPVPASARKVYLVDRPNSVQTTITIGNISMLRTDPDYIPMVVMNRVLGSGPAARLFINLREEKGYTYSVYSFFQADRYPGPWRAAGDVRTEVTDGAMKEFFYELRRIAEQKAPEPELEEAKRSMVASFALSLESPNQLMSYAVVRKRFSLAADYWDTYPAKLMAVTADDVQRVARKYLSLDGVQVVAVGDGSKIKSALEKYGPVEVFSTEGKPVSSRQ
jgi:zinc protease